VAALAVSVSLLLGEGVVRLAGAGGVTLSRGRLHAYDADAGWACAPDLHVRYAQPGSFDVLVRTNTRGLRDREHSLAKPEGVTRVACLGDSFMWGFGVENDEMLSSALERSLHGVETINFGANGYSAVQSLVRLETEALAYDPDWALLTFCWNDLEDNFDDKDGGRPALRMGVGEPHIENRPVRRPWKSPVKQWLRAHSRLFSFGESCWLQYRSHMKASHLASTSTPSAHAAGLTSAPLHGASAQGPEGRDLQLSQAPCLIEVDEEQLEISRLQVDVGQGPELERAWQGERWLIEQIRDTMARHGGHLLVAYVTVQDEVDEDLFTRWLDAQPPSAPRSQIDPHRAATRLGQACEDLKVPFLDLTPAFAESGDPEALFLRDNGHWSAKGHAVAAAAVADRLKALTGS